MELLNEVIATIKIMSEIAAYIILPIILTEFMAYIPDIIEAEVEKIKTETKIKKQKLKERRNKKWKK